MRNFNIYIYCAFVALLSTACTDTTAQKSTEAEQPIIENRLFGILSDGYTIENSEIKQGQTMGRILGDYGVSPLAIHNLEIAAKEVFPLNKIRGGNRYTAMLRKDSLGSKLDYFIYEKNLTDYVVFSLAKETLEVYEGVKPITVKRTTKSATISSSMWGAIMEAQLPYALASEIEDIYQWTVDFFAIQEGDTFTVTFDEKFIEDTVAVGIGRVWGAKFIQGEQTYYAIPFAQNDNIEYWEDNGASLRKQMLKAPLKYSRISSGFTHARLHPIYKVYRPHTGVDYAAPSGTPVHSVADGTVIFKGWGGGGGNTLKVKHPGNITTGYMHLRAYAKGIVQGSKVKQGDVIGYVGSTGASTGPHLDYRVWQGSTPINPLKIPQKPVEPISEDNKAAFDAIKDRIIAELEGSLPAEQRVTEEDLRPAVPTKTEIEKE